MYTVRRKLETEGKS